RKLLAEAFARAREILERNLPLLDRSAKELLAKETFGVAELKAIGDQVQEPPTDNGLRVAAISAARPDGGA
ncbi:MAG: hypothetical protein M0Z28_24880, partial [Rhodospirillales bacterium]|nr:hypothetical protein [Rhodospirillales bacterium]